MTYQKVNGEKKFFKLNEIKPGTVLFEGGVFDKIEPPNEGAQYPTNNYRFRMPDDSFCILNGSGELKRVFETKKEVTLGQKCRVTYLGKKLLVTGKRKGTKMHDYLIEVEGGSSITTSPDSDSEMPHVEIEEGLSI